MPLENTLIIIPAHNESKMISTVVSKALYEASHVLVVNDGSTDETETLSEEAGALVCNTREHVGYGNALREGLLFAVRHDFQYVVTLDADGAHAPSEIGSLFEAHIANGNSLTIGNRFESNCVSHVPTTKRWANFFASALFNRVMRTSLRDVACGFRVMNSAFSQVLLELPIFEGFEFAYKLVATAKGKGLSIGTAPVSVYYDASVVLCTYQQEFIDLLMAMGELREPGSPLSAALEELQALISRLEPVTVVIGGVTLCLHPQKYERGYIFQAQDTVFRGQAIGQSINFDSIEDGNE